MKPFLDDSRQHGKPLLARFKGWMESCFNISVVSILGSLIIFSPLIEGGTTHLPMLVIRVTVLVVVSVSLLRQMNLGTVTIRDQRLYLLLLFFVSWAALSLWWVPYKSAGIQWLLTILVYAGLFAIVMEGQKTDQQIRHIVRVLVGMGLCEGFLGLYQYLWLGEERARGTFFNPNFFASYEIAILSLTLGCLWFHRRQDLKLWEQVLLWLTLAVTCTSFMMAQSRGAFVAFATVIIFVGYIRFGGISLIPIAALLLALMLFPNPLKERMVSVANHDPYAYTRVEIWKSALERIVNNPMGYGLGMFKYTSFQYRFPIEQSIVRYEKRAESSHNEYLQMGVELGLPGLVIFVLGLVTWGKDVRRVFQSDLSPTDRALTTGAAGSVMAILMHGLVDSVFHEPALVIVLVICGGLVLEFNAKRKAASALSWQFPYVHRRFHVLGVVTVGVILAILAFQPAIAWYVNTRGEREANAGNDEEALKWFERAAFVDPGTTAYRDSISRTSIQLFHQSHKPQWLREALEQESIAHALNPLDGRFPYRAGTIYALLAEQKFAENHLDVLREEAEKSFQEAIRLDPFSPFSYLELARIRIAQGREQEGREWLERGLAMEPNFLPARVLLAELSLKSGQQQEARWGYDKIVSIKKQYENRTLSTSERQFLDVDLYPLGRALVLGAKP